MQLIKSRLDRILGAKTALEGAVSNCKNTIEELEQNKLTTIEAQDLTRKCLSESVDLKSYICDLVSSALHSIFGPQYSFMLEPKVKDGVVVGLIPQVKEGENILAIKSCGGGMKAVISTVIRLVFLLFTKTLAPVQILDEQCVNLADDKFQILINMLKEIQVSVPYQLVAITHSDVEFESMIRLIRNTSGNTVLA